MKKVKKILEIFKGSEGPYRIENERPWGGYIVTMGVLVNDKFRGQQYVQNDY